MNELAYIEVKTELKLESFWLTWEFHTPLLPNSNFHIQNQAFHSFGN